LNKPWLIIGVALAAAAALIAMLLDLSRPHREGGELVLFCAAGLLRPVQAISADYEREFGVKVKIEPDGSGALLSKLRVAKERVDLYLAAEESYLHTARSQDLVAEILPVVRQHAVIAVKPGNPLKISKPEDLLADTVKVVIPNPELAAVGRSVERALAGTDTWKKLKARIQASNQPMVSLVGTVNEAAQAVKLGAADAGLVWDATARQFGIEYVEIPLFQERTLEQAMIGVVKTTARPTAALHFARFLSASDRGQLVFKASFFQPISDADMWEDRPKLTLMSGAMLKPAVEELLKQFEEREGVEINTIYAGCGLHVAQMKTMKSGKNPSTHFPDAYFACDVSFMTMVQQWFEQAKRISRNDIVMAVAKGNPKQVKSIQDLTRPELRLALAHPVNSALGALVDDMFKKLGLHEKICTPGRPMVHSDAGHTLINQLRVGAVDVAVVYRSNVLSSPENEKYMQIVEMNLPEAIAVQPYAVAKETQHRYLMLRLLDAIVATDSQERFRKAGFHWVAEDAKP
jgi:molybdate transport system substrate-binding protein